jgi:hypothetical protein
MSRHILAATLLVLASAIGFCSQVKAETVDVPFSGTIAPKCTFSNVVAGTLAQGSSGNLLEGSASFGTQGSVNIFCNTSATVSVGEPADNGSTGPSTFNPAGYGGSIIAVGANIAGSPNAIAKSWQSVSATSLSVSPITTTNIKVSVLRDATVTLQAGTYSVKATLTSTPY